MQSNVTPEDLKRLEDKGWRILQMEGAVENAALSPVQYVLMKAGDATVDNLSLMQIPYRPGGRVQYADKTFLKMGRVREMVGGVPIILRAKTFGVGETENVKDAVKAYEEARQAWMKGGDDADAAIELATSGRFKNREAFQDAIGLKNLEMSRTHNMPFEAVRDGEVLAGVRAKIAKGASFLAEDVAEANTIQRMILQQGSTRSQRGERLPMFGENRMEDFNFDLGRTAPILSPRETASASMSRAIQVMSLDNFRSRQTKIWFDSFSDVIDIEKSPGRTPLGWLMESDKKKYIKPRDKINSVQYKKDVRTINLARTHEQHLRMTMNTPTRYDMARDQIAEGIIASVAPSLSKIGVSEQRLEKIAQADPIKFLRSVTFHTKLGLGGFNQPIVQLQSAALMASIEPVHGTQAILTTPILGLMLMSENSKTLGHMAKIAVRMAPGSDAKVIQEGLEVLKKTNNWRLNSGSLVEQDYHHLSAPTFLGRAIELGRAPFINSERFNKIASTYAAFLKWRKANPNTKIDSDVIDHIRTRGNQMVASMDSVDKSQWQSGVAGAVTQFWGYQARLIEMAAPEAWGGSKAFSPTEKLRIVAGQFAMHGVGGTLGVGPGRKFREILNAEYSQRYGEEPSSDFLDNVEKGMISGYLLPLLLDTDQVNFQTRSGAGLFDSGPIPVIEAFLSGDLDGLPQLDIAGMKLLSDVHEDWSNFLNTVKYVTNWEDAWLVFSVEGMKIFTENISSLRDVEKMRWALDFETFTNNSGGITDTDVNWKRAVAKMFGIDTGSAAATFAAKSILKEMKKDIGKAGRDHAKTLRLWAAGRLTDNDMKKFNFLGQARYGNDWGAIAKSAIRNMSKQEKHKIALLLKAKYYQGTGE